MFENWMRVLGCLAGITSAGSAQENVMRATESGIHSAENVMRPPQTPKAQFVALEVFDFAALLPPPAARGSVAEQAELETVLQVQAWRSAEQVAWAKLIERDTVFNHANLFGEWFTPQRLPQTAKFFQRLGEDMRAIDGAAKKPFQRPRPSAIDARIIPCVALPASTSYPSGSALQAFVWAELLSEVFPERADALRARAERAAWGRVIGGVHFPSDVIAGRRLAPVYLAAARKHPEFVEGMASVKAELQAGAATR
jgi:acid phosphatase (class A)